MTYNVFGGTLNPAQSNPIDAALPCSMDRLQLSSDSEESPLSGAVLKSTSSHNVYVASDEDDFVGLC